MRENMVVFSRVILYNAIFIHSNADKSFNQRILLHIPIYHFRENRTGSHTPNIFKDEEDDI